MSTRDNVIINWQDGWVDISQACVTAGHAALVGGKNYIFTYQESTSIEVRCDYAGVTPTSSNRGIPAAPGVRPFSFTMPSDGAIFVRVASKFAVNLTISPSDPEGDGSVAP